MGGHRPEDSLRVDLKILRESPLFKPGTRIVGFKSDMETGLVTEVE